MSLLIAAVALAAGTVLFILHPLLTGRSASMEEDHHELTEAQHQKRIALLGLRDVEYDHHAGKLDESDYRRLKKRLANEAIEAMEAEARELAAQEGGGALDPALEEEIRALRVSLREGTVCHECGEPNPRGSRFCGECGSPLAAPSPSAGSTPPEPESDSRTGAGPDTESRTRTDGPHETSGT